MLPEASMEITQIAMRAPGDDDKKLYVQFMMHPRLNTELSAKEGRPIFEDKEYIMIMVPGDATSIIHRPVWRESDLERFPMQYQAFKNKQSQDAVSGTPLSVAGFLTQGQIRELEFFHVRTVEHLANMADQNATKFMGIQDLKKKAQDYLRIAAGQAPLTAMRAELENRDQQLANQADQIKALQEALAKLTAKAEVEEEED